MVEENLEMIDQDINVVKDACVAAIKKACEESGAIEKTVEDPSEEDMDIKLSNECNLIRKEVSTEMVIEEVVMELNLVEKEVIEGMLVDEFQE